MLLTTIQYATYMCVDLQFICIYLKTKFQQLKSFIKALQSISYAAAVISGSFTLLGGMYLSIMHCAEIYPSVNYMHLYVTIATLITEIQAASWVQTIVNLILGSNSSQGFSKL